MKSQLLYGSDPEFFAAYMKDKNLYCLPPVFFRTNLGVEAEPNGRHPIFLRGENNTLVHEDGAAFEMSLAPSTNWKDLFDRIAAGRDLLEKQILSKFIGVCDGRVHVIPTINYEVERWKDEGDEFQYCTQFGCDPDEDAFEIERDNHVEDASLHPFRYGGGHIHVSGSKTIKNEPLKAVHSLALTAGLAAVAFSDVPELDKDRTYLYGKPGKFRIQNYGHKWNGMDNTDVGVEYRTPSNRWTLYPAMAQKVFEWLNIGIEYLLEKDMISKIITELRQPAIDAILTCNQLQAKDILNRIEALV